MFNTQKHTMFKKFTLKNDTMDKIVPVSTLFSYSFATSKIQR
jgi:hypothetical protein